MSTEPESSARQRFSHDLRRIREEREVSLAAIHEVTQVPVSHLQAFEEGSLYDQPRMNPVYLKAFVRGYAEAIGISSDSVVEHLEAALAGEYQNQLAVQYLDVPPSVAEESASPDAPDPRSADRPSEKTVEEDESDEADSQRRSALDEASTPPKSIGKDSRAEEEFVSEENGGPTSLSTKEREEGPSTEEDSSQKDTSSRVRERTFSQMISEFWREHLGTVGLFATALFVFVLVGEGLGTYFETTDSSSDSSPHADLATTEQRSDTTVSSDTLSTNSSRRQPPRATLTLDDTLYVTVLATSNVREMRVQQDDDLRRPYWIEEGDAWVFPFTRRITIENELDRLQLFLEQYPYPSSRTDDEGRVVIHRDTVQQFADTLRGAPASFPVLPDTVQIDNPPGADSGSLSSFSQR